MRSLALYALAVSLVLVPLATPRPADAQTRSFDLERASPAPDGDGFLTIPGTRTPGPGRWNVGLSLNYSYEPLIVTVPPRELVENRLGADLFFQLGLGGVVALVLDAPVVLFQDGVAERIDGGPPLLLSAVRDPRLSMRVRVLGEDATIERDRHEGEGLALQLGVTLPIGHEGTFAGEGLPSLDGAVIFDFHLMDLGVGAMLGFRHRFAEPELFGSSFRNQLFAGLGVQVPLFFVDHVVALGELDVHTDAEDPFGDAGSTAAEWRLGLRTTALRDFECTLAAGTGFVGGAGSPLARVMATLSWAPRVHDEDRDGIPDDADLCPTLPEDFDDFEDEDGCPEPDNDHDLVPDVDDLCPNEAPIDGRDLDDDGCTDPAVDSDGDGIDDADDRCPNEAEDRDGFEDEDGCPDPDNDQDGVPDVGDRCPNDAEDLDGFEDEDGCPDPDNDQDGVSDADDRCPNEAEDLDGFEDEDGCPDPDDDHDGVLDAHDRCPTELETINGFEDEDGCPDRGGVALLSLEAPAAEGAPPVWRGQLTWRRGALSSTAPAAIEQIARTLLRDDPYPHRVSVTLPEGSDAALTAFREQLEAAARAIGAPSLRFEVQRSDEGRAGLVRIERMNVGLVARVRVMRRVRDMGAVRRTAPE